jgi:hypothetical protein
MAVSDDRDESHDERIDQQALYLTLVVIAGIALGLNMTPVMMHRRLFGQHEKERVVAVGHVVSQAVIAAVAVLVTGTATLIFSVVESWTAGIWVALGLAVVLGSLLGVLPRRFEQR